MVPISYFPSKPVQPCFLLLTTSLTTPLSRINQETAFLASCLFPPLSNLLKKSFENMSILPEPKNLALFNPWIPNNKIFSLPNLLCLELKLSGQCWKVCWFALKKGNCCSFWKWVNDKLSPEYKIFPTWEFAPIEYLVIITHLLNQLYIYLENFLWS